MLFSSLYHHCPAPCMALGAEPLLTPITLLWNLEKACPLARCSSAGIRLGQPPHEEKTPSHSPLLKAQLGKWSCISHPTLSCPWALCAVHKVMTVCSSHAYGLLRKCLLNEWANEQTNRWHVPSWVPFPSQPWLSQRSDSTAALYAAPEPNRYLLSQTFHV